MASHDKVAAYLDVPNFFAEVVGWEKLAILQTLWIEKELNSIVQVNLGIEKTAYIQQHLDRRFDQSGVILAMKGWKIVYGNGTKDIDTRMATAIINDMDTNQYATCVLISSDADFLDVMPFLNKRNVSVHIFCQAPNIKKDGTFQKSGAALHFLPHRCWRCYGNGYVDGDPSKTCWGCNGNGVCM